LQYWERHQLEYNWDGIAVEYSVNAGPWTDVPAPSNSGVDGCSPSDDTADWSTLTCTGAESANACGFPDTKNLFTGPQSGGSTCGDFTTNATTSYAHRCHRITGLNPDDTIRFRWQFSSDEASEFAGFYLDDIAVTDVKVPNACVPDACAGQPPAEAQSVGAAADKMTYTWTAVPSATRYDVVRGDLSALPVGPGGGDEVCFDDLPVRRSSTRRSLLSVKGSGICREVKTTATSERWGSRAMEPHARRRPVRRLAGAASSDLFAEFIHRSRRDRWRGGEHRRTCSGSSHPQTIPTVSPDRV
jgi:hypothetical protein